MRGHRSFARGALEALGVVGAFVAVGLGAATALEALTLPVAVYAPGVSEPGVPSEVGRGEPVWLVDGYNVLSVGLLAGRSREGWWRPAQRRALLERVGAFDDPGARLWVVFDGPAPAVREAGRACAVFAPSADAWLLERLREAPEPGRITVVTADRRLAQRARRRGAAIATPAAFLARCPVALR